MKEDSVSLITPKIFQQFSEIKAGQSTRFGGLPSDFGDFNLGESVGDHPDTVAKNRDLFCKMLGFDRSQLAKSKQIHGDQILLVEKAGNYEGYDALVTRQKNILLAVTIADCTPILVYDRGTHTIAAIHAGWKGTRAGLVAKVLTFMQSQFHTKAKDIFAFLGPCISSKNYETDEDVALQFDEKYRSFDPNKKKYYLDIKKHNLDQLTNFGVPKNQIEVSPYCTVEDKALFYTHRGDKGKSGRMLAAIGMQDSY